MKASSESGLWATWMVRSGIRGNRWERWEERKRRRKVLVPSAVRLPTSRRFRLLPELLHHRLVLHVLDPLGRHLRLIVGEKLLLRRPQSGGVSLESGRGSSN